MRVRIYVIKRTTIDNIDSYFSKYDGWVPLERITDIHFFTSKGKAEDNLINPTFPDVIKIVEMYLEMD